MSKVKKLFAIILSMAMILGMSVTTFALPSSGDDGRFGTDDDTGVITVSGIEADEDISVVAYQIIKATYDYSVSDDGQFNGYTALYTTNPAIDTDGQTEGQKTSISITQTQMDQIDAMIASGNIAEDTVAIPLSYNVETESYSATVAPGTYLIRVLNSETAVYNPMVVSVYYNTGSLDEGSLSLQEEDAKAKKGGFPDVDKKVDNADGNSAEIGDIVNYTVTINPIPYYGGKYPVLNVVDKLSTGLDYVTNSLTVKVGDTVLSSDDYYDFEYNTETKEITVDFVKTVEGNDDYTLNDFKGQSLTISYQAKINSSAALNENPNNNDVTLNYTRDSKVDFDETPTEDDQTYTYTFEIDGELTGTTGIINKVGDKDEDTAGLNGATFGLYKTNPNSDSEAEPFKRATTATVADKAGQMTFTGLEAGTTYYLKEISAPAGYTLNTNVYELYITATYFGEGDEVSKDDYGKLKSWEVTINGQTAASFKINVEGTVTNEDAAIGDGVDIQNTTLSSLPSTGGMGTTIFTIGGCVIMIAAAGLYFASRRRQENK